MRTTLVPLCEEVQIQQAQDARLFSSHAALVVLEVEAVDGVLGMQAGEAETALDGAAVARFQFQVGERFQCLREAEVLVGGVRERLIELAAHRGQAELVQFLVEWVTGFLSGLRG